MKRLAKRGFTLLLTLIILAGVILPAATPANALAVPEKGVQCNDYRGWAQDDPRWYDVKLNKCKELTFRKLPAGKYIYRVCVTDGNGVSKYVISTSFTVA